ncbi:MAG: hypothetical protein ACSLE6_03505 [Mycobacterium sp.]
MTSMRKATSTVGAAIMLAAASMAGSQATANAEPDPAAPNVRYSITVGAPYDFNLYYLTNEPPSMDAYNADPYAFMKNENVFLTPDAPWVFETSLADPQWGFLSVSSTTRGSVGPPTARCEIAVDNEVVVQHEDLYSPRCQLGQW